MKSISYFLAFTIFFIASQTCKAELTPIKPQSGLKPQVDIAKQWNQFVTDIHKLSQRLIKESSHEEKWRVGGYSNEPAFYDEVQYINKQSGKLTAKIQWERANIENIHSIEVVLRDDKGRTTKDYSASYLTKHRNAPLQTLITLHYYNKDLHAFRVFDASHNRIYEVCRGSLNGKKVNIDLDDDYGELSEALSQKNGITSSAVYKACFGSTKVDPSQLAIP